MGMPVVFLDRPPGQLLADTVLLDNRGGARAGVRASAPSGPPPPRLLLDSLAVYTMRERLAGAQDALADAGVATTTRWSATGSATRPTAARAVGEMLDRPIRRPRSSA